MDICFLNWEFIPVLINNMSGDSAQTSFLKFYGSKTVMLFFKKDLADKNSCFNFAPVLCESLIKKGRGIWPDDALATGNVLNIIQRC